MSRKRSEIYTNTVSGPGTAIQSILMASAYVAALAAPSPGPDMSEFFLALVPLTTRRKDPITYPHSALSRGFFLYYGTFRLTQFPVAALVSRTLAYFPHLSGRRLLRSHCLGKHRAPSTVWCDNGYSYAGLSQELVISTLLSLFSSPRKNGQLPVASVEECTPPQVNRKLIRKKRN